MPAARLLAAHSFLPGVSLVRTWGRTGAHWRALGRAPPVLLARRPTDTRPYSFCCCLRPCGTFWRARALLFLTLLPSAQAQPSWRAPLGFCLRESRIPSWRGGMVRGPQCDPLCTPTNDWRPPTGCGARSVGCCFVLWGIQGLLVWSEPVFSVATSGGQAGTTTLGR